MTFLWKQIRSSRKSLSADWDSKNIYIYDNCFNIYLWEEKFWLENCLIKML